MNYLKQHTTLSVYLLHYIVQHLQNSEDEYAYESEKQENYSATTLVIKIFVKRTDLANRF